MYVIVCVFFHEWGSDERWGVHRTVRIQAVAMHVFFICVDVYKKMVVRPVDVSCSVAVFVC